MSGNLKLKDLKYGTLNDLSPAPQGDSGDRRRTTNMVALSNAIEAAYSINATVGVNEFNGIVVYQKSVTYPSYQNRTSLLQEYVVQNNASRPDDADATLSQYADMVYKVYIPELEPRPAPGGKENQCALLRTYPDVYSDLPLAMNPIPLGTVVVVRFEDKERLFNPRIVRILGEPLRITDITVNAQGPYATSAAFTNGLPGTVGQFRGGTRASGQQDYPGNYTGPDPAYLLPVQGGETMVVSSPYGHRPRPDTATNRERGRVGQPQLHGGIDVPGPEGRSLQAIADGEVTHVAYSATAGYNIQIKHTDVINGGDMWTRYLHMKESSPLANGAKVRAGDIVGLLGNTGSSTGPHLHFEINKSARRPPGGTSQNPVGYYPPGTIYARGGEELRLHALPAPSPVTSDGDHSGHSHAANAPVHGPSLPPGIPGPTGGGGSSW